MWSVVDVWGLTVLEVMEGHVRQGEHSGQRGTLFFDH